MKWAATTIKNKCRKLWRTKDGGGYSDDISVVVVRLGEPNAAAPSAADGRVGRGARRGSSSGSGSSGKSKGLLLEGTNKQIHLSTFCLFVYYESLSYIRTGTSVYMNDHLP